ncbi:MAG TPA: ABC transporter permease [Spirochaetota bacterium]|nr:ABC transporter permease [Spirochaetota bacterium]HPR36833.1 ABC transporter permease [Spirochaetota bacterium]HRX46372.1 ABC transporter permease [Spirochaetota bacterium]
MSARNSIIRLMAIADKEWLQIRRDRRSLILSLIAPLILILLFGFALTMDVKHVKTMVYDQSRTASSRAFIEGFSHTEYIDITAYAENYDDIDRSIDSGRCAMAVVIPVDFEKKIKTGRSVSVQLIVDGSDSTSATVATGYMKAITMAYNIEVKMSGLKKAGFPEITPPVDVRSRIWYNPELESRNFIIPGLIVIILAIISALIASLTISREWERGTMETLITTPVRGWELVFGKLIPYLFIGLFDVMITVCAGYFVFKVPMRGSFIEFYLLALLFLVGTSGLGILISAATRVQVLSVQFAMVATYLPSFILSGFIFPINNMPLLVQGITYAVPARYLIVIVKGIALKGIGVMMLRVQIVFLLIYAAAVLIIAVKKMSLTLPEN